MGKPRLKVSDKGAAAAMLKMDEFQQRLNTPSALIRQGQEKHAVLAPKVKPKIDAVSVNNRKNNRIKNAVKNNLIMCSHCYVKLTMAALMKT